MSATRQEIMTHTPGPWAAVQREWGYPEVEGGPDRRLWSVQDSHGVNIAGCTIYSRDKADATLIAAAPDLLQLAKRYARECAECDGRGYILIAGEQFTQEASDRTREECDECADIREVIAKAEGRL